MKSSERSSSTGSLTSRLIVGLLSFFVVTAQLQETNSQETESCYGFNEVFPYSDGRDTVVFSWRFADDISTARIQSVDSSTQSPTVIPPNESGLFSYEFPPGVSRVEALEGTISVCNFTVTNRSPCSLDPCPPTIFCLEFTGFACTCSEEDYTCDTKTFTPCSDEVDRVFTTLNGQDNYNYMWSLGPQVGSAKVKSSVFSFQEIEKLNKEGLFQHEFPLGTNRVYVFALGEIILCSFDVEILSDPCAENPCESGFRCVLSNDGETVFECICRADLSDEECRQTDLSQCNDEVCDFDAHVCVDSDSQGNYQCECKDGLSTNPDDPTECRPAYVSFRENAIFVSEGAGNTVIHVDLSDPVSVDVNVDFKITDVTTSGNSDYRLQERLILKTRSAGIVILLTLDDLVETSEYFVIEIVNVSSPGVVDYDGSIATITIHDDDVGTVCLPNKSIAISEDIGTLMIPVSISNPIQDESILIDMNVNGITASAGDYFIQANSVFIPLMESETSFPVVITDDVMLETSETFLVSIISVGSPGLIGEECTTTITILDNDDILTATAILGGSQVATEGDVATVAVRLSNPLSSEDIEVVLEVKDGSAREDFDFQSLQQVITIPRGLTDVIASFDILEDDIVEITEYFVVSIVNVVTDRAIITQTSSTTTISIEDNDFAEVSLDLSDELVQEEDNPTVSVTLVTSKMIQRGYGDISVSVAPGPCLISAADISSDFSSLRGTLTIPSGTFRSLPVEIEILDDVIVDPEKCILDIQMSTSPSHISSRVRPLQISGTELTVLDNDNVTVTISPVTSTVEEGDLIVFEIMASRVIEHYDILIIVIEPDGRPINATIERGSSRTTMQFSTFDDAIFTGTKTFDIGSVTLAPICGYTRSNGELDEDMCNSAIMPDRLVGERDDVLVTILDTDDLLLGFSISEVFVHEGNRSAFIPFHFRGIPVNDSIFPFDIAFQVTEGTARSDDYGPIPDTRTLQRNGSAFLEIPITQDELIEEHETIRIELLVSNLPAGVKIDSSVVTVTIIDDDSGRVLLSALRTSISVEENSGTLSLDFLLSRPVENTTMFSVAFEDGSARRNEDYEVIVTSSFIPANQRTSSIAVTIVNDVAVEGNQQFLVFLNTVSNDVRIDRAASNITVTIVDDDIVAGIEVLPRVPSVMVAEGEGNVTVEFYFTKPSEDQDTIIVFEVEDITTRAETDYTTMGTETQIVRAGNTFVTHTFQIINDVIPEMIESFRVFIVNTEPVINFDAATTTVSIVDDDTACASIMDATVEEDEETVKLLVSIPRSASDDIRVDLRGTGRSANEISDFGVVPSSVSIPGGSIFALATIAIINDNEREDDEEFLVEITNVSLPATRCEASSTATVVIIANDEGPIVEFCPADIVVYAAPSRNRAYVRWEPARFTTDEQVSIHVEGPQGTEANIPVGLVPTQMSYEARDEFGRMSTCRFGVSAVVTNDYKTYSISFEANVITDDSPNDNEIQSAINFLLERGECWRDYAGMQFNTNIRNTVGSKSNYKVFYDLYLTEESRCCIRDILRDFNDRLGEEQNVFQNVLSVNTTTHLPTLMREYGTKLTFDVDETVANPHIYRDEHGSPAQNLQQSLIEQISRGFSEIPDFRGVCVVTPFQISSVTVQIILESRQGQNEDIFQNQNEDIFQNRLREITLDRLDLPEGFHTRNPSLIRVTDLCPRNFCSGNGVCVANLNTFVPDCHCDIGWIGTRCSINDPRYCPAGMNRYEDPEPLGDFVVRNITLMLGNVGEVVTENELNPDPCQDFRAEESLNIIEVFCVRNYPAPAQWDIFIDCNSTLEAFLTFLQEQTIVLENVAEVSGQIANASNLFDNQGSMTTLAQTADLVERIVNTSSSSTEVTSNVTITISNILEGDDDVLAESYQNGTTTKLLEAFERQLFQVNVTETGSYSHGSGNIVTMVVEGNSSMLSGFGIATMPPDQTRTESNEDMFEDVMVIDSSQESMAQVQAQSTTLLLYPEELSSEFSFSTDVRVTYAVYRRSNLFSSRYYRNLNDARNAFQRRVKKRLVPNTRVISSTLYNMEGQSILTWDRSRASGNPNSTFRQWYMPLQNEKARPDLDSSVCTFWNFRADGGRGNWSTDGCEFVSINSDGMVHCECTHLTNFVVLMDVFDDDSMTESQLRILEVATFFGCGASILGLVITIVAFASQKNLRNKRPTHVLICLCLTLIGLYASFLVMAVLDSERKGAFLSDWSCSLMAATVHFFTLSSVAWMSVEAVNMYYLFVRVVNNYVSMFLLKAFLFAEGFPLLVVCLTIGISKLTGTDYFRKDVCFLNYPWATLGGTAVPLFVLIVFNTVTYSRIIFKLNKSVHGKSKTEKSREAERLKQFQNAVSILLLLGVTWVLGYFCFIPVGHVVAFVFQLLFVLMNSMQGYLIFMLYGMRNPVFRKAWRKRCLCCPDAPIRRSLLQQMSSSRQRYSSSENKNIPNKFSPSTFPVSYPERRRIDSVANW